MHGRLYTLLVVVSLATACANEPTALGWPLGRYVLTSVGGQAPPPDSMTTSNTPASFEFGPQEMVVRSYATADGAGGWHFVGDRGTYTRARDSIAMTFPPKSGGLHPCCERGMITASELVLPEVSGGGCVRRERRYRHK